jgi:hypothetical protein
MVAAMVRSLVGGRKDRDLLAVEGALGVIGDEIGEVAPSEKSCKRNKNDAEEQMANKTNNSYVLASWA